MQRRIYWNLFLLTLLCVLLLAFIFGMLFYDAARNREMATIRAQAGLMAHLPPADIAALPIGDARITIIGADGIVIADSHIRGAIGTSRADRVEFRDARDNGRGEARRFSGTLGSPTFYYALRLPNGDILRASRTLNSLGEVFTAILPALIVVIQIVALVAHMIARKLTRLILRPFTAIDLESEFEPQEIYEEVRPFIRKINAQQDEIAAQMVALENRAETTTAILENMQEGLVLLDSGGLIVTANKSFLAIFGIVKEEDIIGKNISHIYRDADFRRKIEDCLAGKHSEQILQRGEKIYNIYLNPAAADNLQKGAVIMFIDNTAARKAENLRREFSANVSHELKTPLTTISALAEMMESGMANTADFQDFGAKISAQSRRLRNIVDDIMRLSEFDESKVAADFAPFDINDLAKSVIAALADAAAQKSVKIALNCPAPMIITANSRLIDELIYNLLDNAIKYNKDNGDATIDISRAEGFCRIAVTDTGIGIAPEHHTRIFERFYRAEASRSKRTGGTGLGLSIVKHIAEYHGGRVELTSEPNKGTSIICFIGCQ
ncbi:MAG: ATP-binding protein [Defluviitaleaceae bacterium]|nr:ATP-binding protein [Defluviitaleaceae bacterium]